MILQKFWSQGWRHFTGKLNRWATLLRKVSIFVVESGVLIVNVVLISYRSQWGNSFPRGLGCEVPIMLLTSRALKVLLSPLFLSFNPSLFFSHNVSAIVEYFTLLQDSRLSSCTGTTCFPSRSNCSILFYLFVCQRMTIEIRKWLSINLLFIHAMGFGLITRNLMIWSMILCLLESFSFFINHVKNCIPLHCNVAVQIMSLGFLQT